MKKPIPEGFHTVSPYLVVRGVPRLLEFLEQGLGAQILSCHKMPDGRIANAEIKIGDSIVMTGEAREGGETWPAMLYLYVENPDALYERAMKAGGKSVMLPTDQPYGDRSAAVEDSCGNQWWFAARLS
jgi:uncharacterized glyoxalase superfamily protein PhnB